VTRSKPHETSPVQFDQTSFTIAPAPTFTEHPDEVRRELGRSDDQILRLKIGAIT
jgi:crotonobetainyl-CoA:carnitine CoA-transferase CaiB-like acyl-CoA transferase